MSGHRLATALAVALTAVSCTGGQPAIDCPSDDETAMGDTEETVPVRLTRVAEAQFPTSALATSGPNRSLWVTERRGRLVEIGEDNTSVIVNLSDEVATKAEGGLLDLSIDPVEGWMYLSYTTPQPAMRLIGYPLRDGRPDLGRQVTHLEVPLRSLLHTGGSMQQGLDGMLYLGIGDGSAVHDETGQEGAQHLTTLRGKILRIDPDPAGGYALPSNNPFPESEAPETWLFGVRNPWGFAFDKTTGDLWVADVGEACREEINLVPAGRKGINLGWPHMEGTVSRDAQPPRHHMPPIYEYPHAGPGSAVIGGAVYHGDRIPALKGSFLYADYVRGHLGAIRLDVSGEMTILRLEASLARPTRFVIRPDGEVLVLSETAGIFLIEPA